MFELGFNETLSNNCINEMQKERYEIFKSQDLEKGRFDVTFEVDGKKLHAHSFVLTSVSEYMDALLSDRWSKKNKVVKIESYSYDNFYQFLCFLYTGKCDITNENVFQLVDMAEFFGVLSFKKFCDKVLSSGKYGSEYGKKFLTVGNIEELTEFAFKYSLKEFVDSIREYSRYYRGNNMFKSESFLAFKKPFIEFLISVDRRDDIFFEAIYKWSENRVKNQNDVEDETFNLLEAVKAEMNTILPQIEFSNMSFDFIKDFVVEKGYLLSPAEFKQYFESDSYYEEEIVELAYQLAEKQALQRQKMAPNDKNFNAADSVKADLSEVIKTVRFHEINKEFLTDFVVAKGIITKEQAKCIFYTRVQVENNGKIISGAFKDNLGIRDLIKKRSSTVTRKNTTLIRFSNLKFYIPKTKSTVKKMKSVEWYLCLDENGALVFKHHSKVEQKDYLLAEMKSKEEFSLTSDKETSLKAFYNNIPDY